MDDRPRLNPQRNPRRHADRLGRADHDGRRAGTARRHVPAGRDGHYPVILTYGPYAKGLAFQDGYPSAWERMAESIPTSPPARRTYTSSGRWSIPRNGCRTTTLACASIHAAAGCSPGKVDPFSPRETKDFYDCIEWAGVQPWSNGKIGLNGISYYGSTSGTWQRCSRRISPRCASGRAPPTGTAT